MTATSQRIQYAAESMLRRFARIHDDDELWPETVAMLEIAPAPTARLLQRILGVGPLQRNAARCGDCKEVVESEHRHDFQTCSCGRLSVDGGSWYQRLVIGELNIHTSYCVKWPWIEDDVQVRHA